jgi:hypothetical protein
MALNDITYDPSIVEELPTSSFHAQYNVPNADILFDGFVDVEIIYNGEKVVIFVS